jgi:Transposase
MFLGWDWASATHDVTVLDDAGVVVDRWAFRHTEQDLVGALERLARLAEPAALPVIIERASGLVVERLVAAGHPVVPVHLTAFWAARPRWGASGAKSDPGDSYKLADSLRTDGHRLRRLDPPDVGLQELQARVRLREDHVRARTAASMKLGALLEAYWPGPNAVFFRLASPIALAFLTDYPTPHAAARLGEARMASFCRRHSYRGGRPRPSCWPDSTPHPPLQWASRPPPWRALSAPRSNSCAPCLGPSPSSKRRRHPRRCLSPRPAAGSAARGRHHQPGPAAGRGRADP